MKDLDKAVWDALQKYDEYREAIREVVKWYQQSKQHVPALPDTGAIDAEAISLLSLIIPCQDIKLSASSVAEK